MLKNSPAENRILWLDIVRVLAAFMVVFIHSPKPIEGMSNNIGTVVKRIKLYNELIANVI